MTIAPLAGLRVLDLTNVLAGPFCCHQLAHLGAEIIKVEVPGTGDLARQLGNEPGLNDRLMGISFLAQNPGKKSLTLNLKAEKGREILRRLVATADVLVENFRPGVMDRLGVGYEVLKAENPRLIYCAISGFGQDGPMANRPAYDQIVQGLSGVMSVTGGPDTAPLRVGYPVSDTLGGMTAAFAITAALNAPERGCFIDVSMLESTIAAMGWVVSNYLVGGIAPTPFGNDNSTSAPSGTFQAKDGPINIAANKDEQWRMLCQLIARPKMPDDPRFATRELRKANRAGLTSEINAALASRNAAEWEEALNAAGVPAGAVLTVPQILAHPQIAQREFLATFADVPGVERDITVARTGLKIDGAAPRVTAPPPELGADTTDILTDLGLSTSEIDQLREEGTI